jgi:hypothetical protein
VDVLEATALHVQRARVLSQVLFNSTVVPCSATAASVVYLLPIQGSSHQQAIT